MKFKNIEFTKKTNLGNFENHDVKIQAELEENDNIDEAFKELKAKVEFLGAQ